MVRGDGDLVPTRVGMILSATMRMVHSPSCPHTRGDDPRGTAIFA